MKLGLNTISLWFGLIMALLTFFGALAFAFTDFMDDKLFGKNRIIFIAVLLVYSVYRSFRLYQVFQQKKHEE